jgi:predicted metal-dependent hydrolase
MLQPQAKPLSQPILNMSIDEHYDDFLRGIDEFNRREFFECHDTWEHIWQETTGADKLFLQGIIHAAVGLYHFTNGRWKGAKSQLQKCTTKLAAYHPTYRGVDVALLTSTFTNEFLPAIEKAANGEKIIPPNFPTITLKSQPNTTQSDLAAQLDQQRVLFQNEIEALKRERDDLKEKLKAEQEKFAITLKRHLKSSEKKTRLFSIAIALLVLALLWLSLAR